MLFLDYLIRNSTFSGVFTTSSTGDRAAFICHLNLKYARKKYSYNSDSDWRSLAFRYKTRVGEWSTFREVPHRRVLDKRCERNKYLKIRYLWSSSNVSSSWMSDWQINVQLKPLYRFIWPFERMYLFLSISEMRKDFPKFVF